MRMRFVLRVLPVVFAWSIASFQLGARVAVPLPSVLTVILDFRGSRSATALKEMERESGQILNSTGIRLDWRLWGEESAASYPDLVVMTFRGDCLFQPSTPQYDERGPLATTATTHGEIQPFGEVNCDHVVGSARSAMSGVDFARGDMLVGRAMGRVVAHELVHMLTKSGQHGAQGVEKPALSGRQLIAPSLPLSAFDIQRVTQERQSAVRDSASK